MQHKAQREMQDELEKEADGVLAAMEEAIGSGGEGGAYVQLFEILRQAAGKEKSVKWREGKRKRHAGRPPVLLSAVYKDDDKVKGKVVMGPGNVREEVARLMTRINADKPSFPEQVRSVLQRLIPGKRRERGEEGAWVGEVCTWDGFKAAMGRAHVDTGVGGDGGIAAAGSN